MVQLLELY